MTEDELEKKRKKMCGFSDLSAAAAGIKERR